MKKNSKKLLFWLYPEFQAEREQDFTQDKKQLTQITFSEHLDWLLPDLTDYGRKSLLSHLNREQLISIEKIGTKKRLFLTSLGKRSLEQEIPALLRYSQGWHGEWTIIVFLKAPKSDVNFRYLRTSLLASKAVSISRGVFFYPGSLPKSITDILDKLYFSAVLLCKVRSFEFGDEKIIIGQRIGLSDIVNLYSGISNESSSLLMKKTVSKRSINQLKTSFISIFDRLFEIVENDFGLVDYYFPQVENPLSILLILHKIVSL
ncbi:MAG: hypothetical protein PVJ09_00010 [Candidatus Woesebacteria bacterium]